ncbi:hypothetical protein SAMN02745216_02889 [Desulfatibacillum alkenivorans DSM 16219]|jgi:hypothetical protein|uniref:Uncharacterized protein n=1 Tax=Desulfatibacillum alkenivorans DSM 16219 TaxID=1121393 RepID=A0A1M6PSJ4_9BACT|nr:hypothetical protein [Desulfatibacillum alkenivorans]SHK10919.1 hypothetical protein SAMN02745216_02889 [Desulfatibacillum alkenivorans DSM 16219]
MRSVNRSAVIVKPNEPFLNWLKKLYPEEAYSLEDIRNECTVFLIPEYDMVEEAQGFIKRNFKTIFRLELGGWSTDPKNFPGKLTYKMFCEWFACEINSEVYDLSAKKITVEDA